MWDYDKLFAEGNIVGILYPDGEIVPIPCKFRKTNNIENLNKYYGNENLSCEEYKIQYIIRLDEHGNVVEKLFDREKDMRKPMPELETGMFVRVDTWGGAKLGFIDAEHNHVIYQEGGYDYINDDDIDKHGIASKIIAVYDKDTRAFDFCTKGNLIWCKNLNFN